MDELRAAAIPIVIGALVAALSALVKTTFERRDERLTAHRQLELATKRTDFVTGWLAACRTLDADDDFGATTNDRARAELEEAYEEAKHALAGSQTALTRSRSESLVEQLRTVLLLDRRKRRASYVVVIVFYTIVVPTWLSVSDDPRTVDGKPNTDYWGWEQYAIWAAFVTVALRVLCGLLISWLERRGTPATRPPGSDTSLAPPQASTRSEFQGT